jgi:hypothetical protein
VNASVDVIDYHQAMQRARRHPFSNPWPWLALVTLVGAACAHEAPAPPAHSEPARARAAATNAESGSDGLAAVRTPCGALIVANDGAVHFTVELSGGHIELKQHPDGLLIRVDDLIVQTVNTSRAQIGAPAATKTGVDLLRTHLVWESEYMGKLLATKLETHEVDLIGATGAHQPERGLMWWFAVPATPQVQAGHSVYATFELAEHVVGLSARTLGDLQPAAVMERLGGWMGSFRASPGYVSPQTLGVEMRAKSLAGETCHQPREQAPVP